MKIKLWILKQGYQNIKIFFEEQLETNYTDFLQKTEIIKLDVEETKKQFQLHKTSTIDGFKEHIKGYSQTIQNELKSINFEYQKIKEDLQNKFPQSLVSFDKKIFQIQQSMRKVEKNHFNEKEKIKEFHQWLMTAQENSRTYLGQLLEFIEQVKEEKRLEIISLVNTFEKDIKEEHKLKQKDLKDDFQDKTLSLEKIINTWLGKKDILQSLEKTSIEKKINF